MHSAQDKISAPDHMHSAQDKNSAPDQLKEAMMVVPPGLPRDLRRALRAA